MFLSNLEFHNQNIPMALSTNFSVERTFLHRKVPALITALHVYMIV